MEKARTLWPNALEDLPMADAHIRALKTHWRELKDDFRIENP
jgi:serine/threonine-protein kinase HipA